MGDNGKENGNYHIITGYMHSRDLSDHSGASHTFYEPLAVSTQVFGK